MSKIEKVKKHVLPIKLMFLLGIFGLFQFFKVLNLIQMQFYLICIYFFYLKLIFSRKHFFTAFNDFFRLCKQKTGCVRY